MDDWKRLISRGNASFERGELGLARALYQDALFIAERRLPSWPDADAVVAAFVVSHHNLANLHQRLDQMAEAADHRMAAHARLIRHMADPACAPALQQAALRHSHRARAESLAFATNDPEAELPLRWLHDTADVATITSVH